MKKKFSLNDLIKFFELSDEELVTCVKMSGVFSRDSELFSLSSLISNVVSLSLVTGNLKFSDLLNSTAFYNLFWIYFGYSIDFDEVNDVVKINLPFTIKRELSVADKEGNDGFQLVATDHIAIKGISNFYVFSRQVICKMMDASKGEVYDAVSVLINSAINRKYLN